MQQLKINIFLNVQYATAKNHIFLNFQYATAKNFAYSIRLLVLAPDINY